MRRFELPEIVRRQALAVGAGHWLEDLSELVADLEKRWSVEVGATLGGGTEAFVAEATRRNGEPVVLKVLVPRKDEFWRNEIILLRLAAGEGCVKLLEDDFEHGATLLERLGPSMFDLGLAIGERHEALCAAAEALWRPAPDCGLPSGAEKGRYLVELIDRLWEQLDRPCSERVVAHAIECAERRIAGYDAEQAVLVHGDVHQWNALRSGDGFKLVDPDGLLAEPEYDLGILMREDPERLPRADPRSRSRFLAGRTGLDEQRIWEWGVVERVSTGLLCAEIDMQPAGRQLLAAAECAAEF